MGCLVVATRLDFGGSESRTVARWRLTMVKEEDMSTKLTLEEMKVWWTRAGFNLRDA